MRKLFAVAGAFALIAVPGAAAAAPAGSFNDWCGGQGQYQNGPVHSEEWPATWAESTSTANWYLSPVNTTGVAFINCASSGEYLELADIKNSNNCMTVSSTAPYQIYDYTCLSGRASQEWGVVYYVTDLQGNKTYALFNQYIQQHVAKCFSGHYNLVITASGDGKTNAGLHMACPTTGGDPNLNQQWIPTFLSA